MSLSSAILLIDISKERIGDEETNYLDIIQGFSCYDDGSTKAAVREAERNRFIKKLFGNAVLEVWSEDGKLLGRKDAYLPANIDPNRTHENYKKAAEY